MDTDESVIRIQRAPLTQPSLEPSRTGQQVRKGKQGCGAKAKLPGTLGTKSRSQASPSTGKWARADQRSGRSSRGPAGRDEGGPNRLLRLQRLSSPVNPQNQEIAAEAEPRGNLTQVCIRELPGGERGAAPDPFTSASNSHDSGGDAHNHFPERPAKLLYARLCAWCSASLPICSTINPHHHLEGSVCWHPKREVCRRGWSWGSVPHSGFRAHIFLILHILTL